jgi:hypothetical protein
MIFRSVPGAAFVALSFAAACNESRPVAPHVLAPELSVSTISSKASPANLTSWAYYFGIGLSWTDNAHNESEFRILRSSTGPSGPFALIAKAGANATGYSDTTIAPVKQYCYQVQGYQNSRLLGTTNTSCVSSKSLLPTAPYQVAATLASGSEIVISWQDSTSFPTGYRLERGQSIAGPFTVLKTTPSFVTSYSDVNVPIEQQLCYRVVASNSKGEGPPSSASCTGVPTAPTNISATSPDPHSILVTWTDASSYEDGYAVYRFGPDRVWTLAASLAANTSGYRDTALQVDVLYAYSVRAKKGTVEIWGTTVRAVTADVPPATPVIHAFPLGSTITEINWTPLDLADGYIMELSRDNGATWQVTSQSPSYSYQSPPPLMQEDLTPEQPVCFRVTAFNGRGKSAPSDTSCTMPLDAPTITDVVVTDSSFDFSWIDDPNATQGYEVDYTVCYEDVFWYYRCDYYAAGSVPAHTTSFHVGGLASGTEYDFQLFGLRDGGHSDPGLFGSTTQMASLASSSRVQKSSPLPSWRGPFARYMNQPPASGGAAMSRAPRLPPGVGLSSKNARRLPIPVGVPTPQPSRMLMLPRLGRPPVVNYQFAIPKSKMMPNRKKSP